MLLAVSPVSIEHVVRFFTAHELAQDPHDFIASHLLHSASQLTRSATVYGGIYLLSHGITKVVLVVLVLKDKLWAYPLIIALLLAFIANQVYRLTYKVSFGLVVLTLFDMLVVWLTWREYRIKRRAMIRKIQDKRNVPDVRPACGNKFSPNQSHESHQQGPKAGALPNPRG